MTGNNPLNEINDKLISFRRLEEADLLLMHRWLNLPEVAKWWTIGGQRYPSPGVVASQMTPRINGTEPMKPYLVLYGDNPIGYIQCALNEERPGYQAAFKLEGSTVGLDVFIGEDDFLHRGLGNSIIAGFLRDVVWVVYGVSVCTIDPEPENAIAIRSYQKAGFRHVRTVWNPMDKVPAYLMEISR